MNKLIPVSNSILFHQRELGDAIWTFLWLVDNTTQIRRRGRGRAEGLVADGQKLKAATIAKALGLSVRAVNRHIGVLCKAGFVRKMGSLKQDGFAVAGGPMKEVF
jgi:hypothetical protein